ncbi:regulator of G protein signaling domain-containing protein [Chlamydoabsidia padenii]|nr:regulator of G protein signaling domain-containing protein [Chlamydoabsidia padenii]
MINSDSSRQAYTSMMKFTIDGRPYLKDIHDLFAALIVQTPLTTHRYLFRNYYNTFSSEDAITALGSLRFSHTMRTPDPLDPGRMTRTTTTTTFNMAKDMAKALCSQFQACHLMQNAVDPSSSRSSSNSGSSGGSGTISDKALWQLTPKGLCVLQDFCVRTEVDMTAMRQHFSDIHPIQLVRLERQSDDDQLMLGRQNVSLIFTIMITSLPLEGDLLNYQNQQASVPALTKSPTHNKHQQQQKKDDSKHSSSSSSSSSSTISSSSSDSSVSLPLNAAPFAMSTHSIGYVTTTDTLTTNNTTGPDSKVQLLGNYLLTLSKTNPHLLQSPQKVYQQQQQKGYQQRILQQTTPSSYKKLRTAFPSQLACDWLIDYSTVSCYEEGEILLAEFIKYGWVECQDAKYADQYLRASTKIILVVTDKGKQILTETAAKASSSSSSSKEDEQEGIDKKKKKEEPITQDTLESKGITTTSTTITATASMDDTAICQPNDNTLIDSTKESNASKLKIILDDAQLRSLFKDFLRSNFCEENLDFWIDYSTLRRKIRNQSPALPSQNQKDLLEDAYDLYATYLKPSAASELNVEHAMRQEMARVVNAMVTVVPTYAVGQQTSKNTLVISSHSVSASLRMILKWLDKVNDHICRLMATDSVPKFVKTHKYKRVIEARELAENKEDADVSLYF